MSRMRRLGLAVAGALACLAGAAGAAESAQVETTYNVKLLGVTLATAEVVVQRRQGRPHRARLHVASAGAGGAIGRLIGQDFESWERAQLQPGPTGPVPKRAEQESQERTVTYRYDGDGRLQAIKVDPAEDRDRYTLPQDAIRRAPPLHTGITAFVAVLETVARTGRCELRVPVFTGRARFDLVAKDKGPVPMAGNLGGQATGPARRCRLERQIPKDHGFPDKLATLDPDNDGAEPSDREAARALIVPIMAGAVLQRFKVPTRFGTGRAVLQRLKVRTDRGDHVAQRPF